MKAQNTEKKIFLNYLFVGSLKNVQIVTKSQLSHLGFLAKQIYLPCKINQ